MRSNYPSTERVNGAKLVEIRPFKVSPKNFCLYPITPVALEEGDKNSKAVWFGLLRVGTVIRTRINAAAGLRIDQQTHA